MGFMKVEFYSEALEQTVPINVALPKINKDNLNKKYQVLYLLHGASDDYSKWARRVPIERVTREKELIVVMADAGLSFYSNTADSYNYWDFFSSELINFVDGHFPTVSDREHRMVAGLSMGGFGSLKLGILNPEKFSKIGSFSGAAMPDELYTNSFSEHKFIQTKNTAANFIENGFGPASEFNESANDLLYQLKKAKDLPKMYISCGDSDFLIEMNRAFHQTLNEMEIPHTYEEWPGDHDWDFWEESLKRFVKTI
ncbi:esterase family protein [Enterococcus sp. 669A]|uniref:Esterase family protein n=1 Tax=Candidatus Enterococcus moelleringii TaxID=2815325 RepID=A0ABS3L9H0_9ENTE|nr:alpha/beta hydrolase family protein [Enterococcus sp. 669A]MBO1306283.1 esterase family protein [Enterococcus sp. 669A]